MLPDVLVHGDQSVRQSAKGLTVEVCRWTGKETVKKLLFDGLREATVRFTAMHRLLFIPLFAVIRRRRLNTGVKFWKI